MSHSAEIEQSGGMNRLDLVQNNREGSAVFVIRQEGYGNALSVTQSNQ